MRDSRASSPELARAFAMESLALEYLLSLQDRGIKLDLERMRAALADLGRPQDAFESVLVAGTNGKGSTASALASILQRPGRVVGLFTSPHLVEYHERIRINGRMIDEASLSARILADREVFDRHSLTFFEATVALALGLFRERGVSLAVLEVGLGGRLDATNVVEPVLSVVAPIGYDHMHLLGDSLTEIAGEKAGIFRPGVPAVLAGGYPEATRTLDRVAREIAAPAHHRPRCLYVRGVEPLPTGDRAGGSRFQVAPRRVHGQDRWPAGIWWEGSQASGAVFEIAVSGVHQVANASLAILAAISLPRWETSLVQVRSGLDRWRWPGRLERPRPGLPLVFDCGHNREGGRSLAAALRALRPRRPIELVVGMVDKKDHPSFFREMRRVTDHVWVAPPSTPRAAPREVLEEAARRAGLEVRRVGTIAEGLQAALALAREPEGPLAVLAGSLFTLEDGYRALGAAPSECLWSSDPEVGGFETPAHAQSSQV